MPIATNFFCGFKKHLSTISDMFLDFNNITVQKNEVLTEHSEYR